MIARNQRDKIMRAANRAGAHAVEDPTFSVHPSGDELGNDEPGVSNSHQPWSASNADSEQTNQDPAGRFATEKGLELGDLSHPMTSQAALAMLQTLREAHDSASKLGRDPWDFAIELSQFVDVGISTHVLRLLVCKDWIAHKRETSDRLQSGRAFVPEADLVFSDRTCFVITKLGYQLADHFPTQQSKHHLTKPKERSMSTHHAEPSKKNQNDRLAKANNEPLGRVLNLIWDRKKRELRVGDRVVKQFKWPAENQERILDAFQDSGWPLQIKDPLPSHPEICPKRRLHDTLKCLNRKQANELIKFRGDGTGLGVILELNLDGIK